MESRDEKRHQTVTLKAEVDLRKLVHDSSNPVYWVSDLY